MDGPKGRFYYMNRHWETIFIDSLRALAFGPSRTFIGEVAKYKHI
jgi:hypothetical protein